MEKDLMEIEQRDKKSGHVNKSRYATNYAFLDYSDNDGDTDQKDLIMEIRAKLREYDETLLRLTGMQNLKKPDCFDINDLQHFLGSYFMCPYVLSGNDARIWGSVTEPLGYKPDMIGLRLRKKEDHFSNWLAQRAMVLFKCGLGRFKKREPVTGEVGYYDQFVLKLTFWVTSMLASLIPIASMVLLMSVDTLPERIGVMATFNVLMSMCLMIFTDATRSDCFAVNAAFTAVQILFIGVVSQHGMSLGVQ